SNQSSFIFTLRLPPGSPFFPYTTLFRSQVREELTRAIKASAPSYGIFNAAAMRQFTPGEPDDARKALAPIDNIPKVSQRAVPQRSEEHTSELQSLRHLVCRPLLEKKKKA